MSVAAHPDLVVEARGLTKHYGAIVAVQSLDLNVRRGEVYGFLGPNGAGKTTTLRMLLGLIRPTSGTARVVGGAPGSVNSLRKIGAIVETPAFYPYLSGYDNLRVVAGLSGVPSSRIATALDEVELTPRAKHKFGTYSMGMKQRLGVAAALIKERLGIEIDLVKMDLDDSKAYELIAAADTHGVFQLDGAGMRRMLTEMRPQDFGDVGAYPAGL